MKLTAREEKERRQQERNQLLRERDARKIAEQDKIDLELEEIDMLQTSECLKKKVKENQKRANFYSFYTKSQIKA